jgi:hypothetical protein
LLRPDGLLRPCNDICRRSCRHFWRRIGILEPGLVIYYDSFKIVSSDSCRIQSISVDASTCTAFWAGKSGTQRHEDFQSQLSLKNVFNHRPARQEVLCKYSGTGKRILLKKCRKLRPKIKGGRPVRGAWLQNNSPFLNFQCENLIWDRPYASAASVIRSSWWFFWGSVLHPEISDAESSFLFRRLSSIT